MTASLFPPRLEAHLGSVSDSDQDQDQGSSSRSLPLVHANLMPFSIEYDGPAPIDTFMVLRPAPHQPSAYESGSGSGDVEGTSSQEKAQSFISAFRGRSIQSTSLSLPEGFSASLVQFAQVAPPPKGNSPTTAEASTMLDGKTQTQHRRTKPQAQHRPAKQQKFSMDSDDDDDDEEEEEDGADDGESQQSQQDGLEELQQDQYMEQDDGTATQHKSEAVKTVMSAQARVANDELRIWGADGPIDRGDDTFFKGVEEWIGVVGPLPTKTLPGKRKGPGSGRAMTGGKKHLRRHLGCQKTALEKISKGSLRRLARRGGVFRLAGTVYEEFRFVLQEFLARTISDSIVYAGHCNRKTIQVMDVIYALKRQGRTLYHF